MNETNEAVTVEERYSTSINSSNLRVECHKGGAADILICAGWSHSRIGAALMRLHSEFDGSAKPRKPTKEGIEVLAATLDRNIPHGLKDAPLKAATQADARRRLAKAKAVSSAWHLHEVGILLGKLKTLPDVRREVEHQAHIWRMDDPAGIAAAVLLHWLDHTCMNCNGTGEKDEGGTCRVCHGSGIAACPGGEAGRKLANWLDDCKNIAARSIKKRLHNLRAVS